MIFVGTYYCLSFGNDYWLCMKSKISIEKNAPVMKIESKELLNLINMKINQEYQKFMYKVFFLGFIKM